jgi:hypothetical protein
LRLSMKNKNLPLSLPGNRTALSFLNSPLYILRPVNCERQGRACQRRADGETIVTSAKSQHLEKRLALCARQPPRIKKARPLPEGTGHCPRDKRSMIRPVRPHLVGRCSAPHVARPAGELSVRLRKGRFVTWRGDLPAPAPRRRATQLRARAAAIVGRDSSRTQGGCACFGPKTHARGADLRGAARGRLKR